jgi:large subunit ribosomal protein L10
MNRSEKATLIDAVRTRFDASPFVVLTEFKGATVAEMDALRRSMEASGAHFQVVKNTLSRLAVEGTDKAALASHFIGNVGILFSGEDPIATAKAFRDQLKTNEKITVKAGFFEGDVLDAPQVSKVADLPSREELLGKLLATIQEGPRQVLGVLQGPGRDLLYLLNNFAAKLEEQG